MKRKSRTIWSTRFDAASDLIEANGLTADAAAGFVAVTVAVTAEAEAGAGAETLIVDRHVAIRDHHRMHTILRGREMVLTRIEDGDPHHRAVSATSTFQAVETEQTGENEVVDEEEDARKDRASAVALLQSHVPGLYLHPLVALDAHHLPPVLEVLRDVEHDDRLHQIVQNLLYRAALDTLRQDPGLRHAVATHAGTGHGLQATTAEGCTGINRDLLPLTINRAHQQSGCPDRRLEPHRVVVAAAQSLVALHDL